MPLECHLETALPIVHKHSVGLFTYSRRLHPVSRGSSSGNFQGHMDRLRAGDRLCSQSSRSYYLRHNIEVVVVVGRISSNKTTRTAASRYNRFARQQQCTDNSSNAAAELQRLR
jgi:hypothetical protein